MRFVIKIRDWKMGFRAHDIKLKSLNKLNLTWRVRKLDFMINGIIVIWLKPKHSRSKRKPCSIKQPIST